MSMRCRICGEGPVVDAGEVEYLSGYAWMIRDCKSCGCRFSKHDNSVYDLLHSSGAISYYREYRELASESKRCFDRRDLSGLKHLLCESSKYRFIINEAATEPSNAKMLEVGCSRGYLTSYFILDGKRVLGIDVSSEAIESAQDQFGEHFALADSVDVKLKSPYDVIYHVGMIGCVADPIGFTNQLLSMLRPNGRLLFNAPNRDSCSLRGQLWIDSAAPPDLVTLFPPGFWKRQFGETAEVIEEVEMYSGEKSLEIGLRRFFVQPWKSPLPRPLAAEGRECIGVRKRHYIERAILKVGRTLGISCFVPKQPHEFGLFVKMIRK